ncbi:hypothetical protein RHSIM_Rhsim10G0066100 [Rhododendron simsii]|uniref:Pentatricopeptide repeat-containing protein n=1 Tax=Rhododendron simsii TaxID=118357 RepID=A0A834GCF4_RHOSS|nr:hypothetical protein RHSIM_Rhsim10G0066100 [Rhododendron simsii]
MSFIAVQARRITAYLGRLNSITYKSQFQFQFQFSTFNLLPNPSNKDEFQNPPTIQPPIDESHVLNRLSDLLPIRRRTTVPEHLTLTSPYEATRVNKGNLGGEAMVMFSDWAKPSNRRSIKMEGTSPVSDTWEIVMDGYVRARQVSKAIRMFGQLEEFGSKCDTESLNVLLRYLIEGLGRAGHIDDAVELFDITDFDEGIKYYECMLRNNCEPSLDTYTRLIAAFLKARRVADVIEMFDSMLCRGLIPTSGTVTSFIEPLCSYGPPHAALMIYEKASKVGCWVSLTAYKLLLMLLSRFGKCGMLLNAWDEMQKSGYASDVEVYEHVINGLCNIWQLENAILVMEEYVRKAFCPSRLIYSKLSNKLLSSNKVDMAYKLFLKIKVARRSENARRLWCAKGWHF